MDYCEPPVAYTWFDHVQCYYEGAPISYMVPHDFTTGDIHVLLAGYSANPVHCVNANHAKFDTVVVKPCAGHYPNQALYPDLNGWWGYFIDDRNTRKIEAGIAYAKSLGGEQVEIHGTSYGGTGAIMQSTQVDAAIVRADIPHTLFVKNFPANATLAWGDNDRSALDFRLNANESTYYLIGGSPQDDVVTFDLDIFNECDRQRLACVGKWHDNGHSAMGTPQGHPVRYDEPLVAFNGAGVWGEDSYATGLDWITVGEGHYLLTAETPTTADVTVRRSGLPDGVYLPGPTVVDGGKFTIEDLSLPTEIQLTRIPGC